MSTNCHDCGYRDTEVKSGGATSEKGRKITLRVEDTDDLSRDILKVSITSYYLCSFHLSSFPSTFANNSLFLYKFFLPPSLPLSLEKITNTHTKSETAGLTIPEIELELNPGTLGGRFTTLEGILNQVYEELDDKVFARGDSAVVGEENAMGDFLAKLKQVGFFFSLCYSIRHDTLSDRVDFS